MRKFDKAITLYDLGGNKAEFSAELLIDAARHCVREQFDAGISLTSPKAAAKHCQVLLAGEPQEVFFALWLNNQHEVIHQEILSRGTIDSATIYPREVVKAALACNAAAVAFAHNHPSGRAEPSQADTTLTKRLKAALSVIDIRLLDHLVVGKTVVSMAERGLL